MTMALTANWRNLEDQARNIAALLWQCQFSAKPIGGVNFDCVGQPTPEETVIIEVSKEKTLDKVRTDIAKLLAVRMQLVAQAVVVRSYIVIGDEPTASMITSGEESKVTVLSIASFANKLIQYDAYITSRHRFPFGSSIDPITGAPDENTYISVEYIDRKGQAKNTVEDISKSLVRSRRIILLGDYGTGKSRCAKEVFSLLASNYKSNYLFPLAINLREHWGAAKGIEIIAGHLARVGQTSMLDRVIQLLNSGRIILLLDGFDEVGTQTFGNDNDRKFSIRKQALAGVKDLLGISKGGILVTGRPHYFHNDVELSEAFGMVFRNADSQLLECPPEFSTNQAAQYVHALGLTGIAPTWLPKKPLMFQVLATLEKKDAQEILDHDAGEISFWGKFIDIVCIREAAIHSSMSPVTVRDVLANLAKITRKSSSPLGRLTPKDVNLAYEKATGNTPDEAGALMLSRLCTLGRIDPESPDRQFVDTYIIQLLFAENVISDIFENDQEAFSDTYQQPLLPIGLYFLAQWLETYGSVEELEAKILRYITPNNKQLLGEAVSALLLIPVDKPMDFSGVLISGAEICYLSLGSRAFCNITFEDCIFHILSFENSQVGNTSGVVIKNSLVSQATGLSSQYAKPQWMEDCDIELVDNVSNASRIKASHLHPSQKLFLSIVHKIFFQRGGGRKDNSLYKGGFGQGYDKKLIDEILKMMLSEGLIEKSKDSSSYIYNPHREHTARMKSIRDQLALSKDPLWLRLAQLN